MEMQMEYTCDLTVDNVIVSIENDDLVVALVKRKYPPYEGMWGTPGGFVEVNEETQHAAARELQEETSLINIPLHRFGSFDAVGRNPRGRTIAIGFYGVTKLRPITGADDAELAAWTPLQNIKKLAFDHNQIVTEALACLRKDALCSAILRSLVTDAFSEKQLLDMYSIVLGHKVNKELFMYLEASNIITPLGKKYLFTHKSFQPHDLWQP